MKKNIPASGENIVEEPRNYEGKTLIEFFTENEEIMNTIIQEYLKAVKKSFNQQKLKKPRKKRESKYKTQW